MIGQRWHLECTVETMNGPDSAAIAVLEAVEATGWLWVCRDTSSWSQLLPSEHDDFVRGTRPVASSVELIFQPMQPPVAGELDDEIIDAILEQLRAARVPCKGISVARYLSSAQ